jgi:hypothetical protein
MEPEKRYSSCRLESRPGFFSQRTQRARRAPSLRVMRGPTIVVPCFVGPRYWLDSALVGPIANIDSFAI